MQKFLEKVTIDNDTMKPKYLQLADAIAAAVNGGHATDGETLPSIHDFCVSLDVSKTTVQKAYTILKERGVIGSFQGKGHFITIIKSK